MCFYRDQGIMKFSDWLMAGAQTELAVLLLPMAPKT
jgi:hypothetical protein